MGLQERESALLVREPVLVEEPGLCLDQVAAQLDIATAVAVVGAVIPNYSESQRAHKWRAATCTLFSWLWAIQTRR